jgi:hypothetical protein
MRKVFVVVGLLAVTVFASDPRLTVLGGDARLLVNDYLEMWAYPGIIGDYEFVTGGSETGVNDNDGWFGIVDGFGSSTYGVAINHNGYSHEVLFSPGSWGAIASMDYGKFAPTDSTTQKDMKLGVVWGTDVPLFTDYSDLAIGAEFSNTSINYNENNWSSSNFGFRASLRGHRDGFFNLFPIVKAGINTQSKNTYADSSFSVTGINFELGAGRNRKVADKTNLVLGVFTSVQSTSYSGDYGENQTPDSEVWIDVPRVSGGVEQEIGKWMVFRAGAVSTTNYYVRGDFNQFTNSFDTNFGIGLHCDNFVVDATITEGFLHSGPYMVGGNANGFMGSVAATYNF